MARASGASCRHGGRRGGRVAEDRAQTQEKRARRGRGRAARRGPRPNIGEEGASGLGCPAVPAECIGSANGRHRWTRGAGVGIGQGIGGIPGFAKASYFVLGLGAGFGWRLAAVDLDSAAFSKQLIQRFSPYGLPQAWDDARAGITIFLPLKQIPAPLRTAAKPDKGPNLE